MRNIIGWFILVAAGGFYCFSIGWVITRSLKGNQIAALPSELESFTTAIGAILLANFGAALGIALQQRQSAVARQLGLFRASPERNIPPPASAQEQIQLAAVYVFLISLVACVITWLVVSLRSSNTTLEPMILHSSSTFFGILTAYVASLLTPSSNNR